MIPFEIEYGVGTTIRHVELIAVDGTTFTGSLASGDVKVRKDGGSAANIGTLPTLVGSSWVVTLTSAEAQGAQIAVEFADQDGPAFVTKTLAITTLYHPSAYDPAGVVLAGTAVTGANTDNAGFELASAQVPEQGQDIDFVSGDWKGKRVVSAVTALGGGQYRAVYDRATDAVVTGRYRLSGGSLPTSVEEFQLDLATQGDTDALALNIAALDAKIDTLDTVADAVKVKTDSLTFTQAGHVDANIQRINDVAITGDGSGTPFNV